MTSSAIWIIRENPKAWPCREAAGVLVYAYRSSLPACIIAVRDKQTLKNCCMNPQFLDFEQPIAELEAKIEELRHASDDAEININEEIGRLQSKCQSLTKYIFSKLSAWQIVQLARHPQRPYTLDYIERITTEFQELHGDRIYSDDPAMVTGIGRLAGRPVAIVGHQKGRDTKDKLKRNFGMPCPEGYRKALRIMKMAEKFHLPLITFIDTPGAYPGVGAEERGQSEAIARNLFEMAGLRTPIVCIVIGEGGSGGALAIGVGDRLMMMEYSTYSVISPEGCASILWKSAEKAADAAAAMGITSGRLKELGLVDQIVPEPVGGAHRDFDAVAESIKQALVDTVERLSVKSIDELIDLRFDRLSSYGNFKTA